MHSCPKSAADAISKVIRSHPSLVHEHRCCCVYLRVSIRCQIPSNALCNLQALLGLFRHVHHQVMKNDLDTSILVSHLRDLFFAVTILGFPLSGLTELPHFAMRLLAPHHSDQYVTHAS